MDSKGGLSHPIVPFISDELQNANYLLSNYEIHLSNINIFQDGTLLTRVDLPSNCYLEAIVDAHG